MQNKGFKQRDSQELITKKLNAHECTCLVFQYFFCTAKKNNNKINPLTPLLFLENLKILNKFENCFLSLIEDRALPGIIKNVVMA